MWKQLTLEVHTLYIPYVNSFVNITNPKNSYFFLFWLEVVYYIYILLLVLLKPTRTLCVGFFYLLPFYSSLKACCNICYLFLVLSSSLLVFFLLFEEYKKVITICELSDGLFTCPWMANKNWKQNLYCGHIPSYCLCVCGWCAFMCQCVLVCVSVC